MSSPFSLPYSLTGKNEQAQSVASRQAAKMVTNTSKATQAAIRSVIVKSIREGQPVYDSAKQIRAMVGMNEPQAMAAANYRRELIDSGLSEARVDTLFDRYVEKKIRERATMIARTETLQALGEGEREEWKSAQEEGLLGKDARIEWMGTADEHMCDDCTELDGTSVPMGDSFPGGVEGPPLHPSCRCSAVVVP